MNIIEIIKEIMNKKDVSNAALAKNLHISRATMWDRLNSPTKKTLTVSLAGEILNELGYKLQAVPKETELPEGGYELGSVLKETDQKEK